MFSKDVSASHEKLIHFLQKLVGNFQFICTRSGFILSLLVCYNILQKKGIEHAVILMIFMKHQNAESKQGFIFCWCIFSYTSNTSSSRHIHHCCMRIPKAAEYQDIWLQQTWKCGIPTKKPHTNHAAME